MIYARTDDDIPKWKTLCKPLTLNAWILEHIERGIERKPVAQLKDTEELNALRKRVQELTKENEMMAAKLHQNEVRQIKRLKERSEERTLFDKQLIDLLKQGGCYDSGQINVAMKTLVGEPSSRYPKMKRRRDIMVALKELEEAGLVEWTQKGWEWIK
jgi:hypothetical protein